MVESLSEYEIGPGRVVAERYEIVRAHRQGGLSVAFEAKDLAASALEARCELQLFPPSLFDGEQQVHEFAAAWAPWRRLHSSRVLRVRDVSVLGPATLVLVTDLPRGRSLRDVLREGRALDGAAVLELGLAMLEGLSAIHALGLVHGDVKPSTVWVNGADGLDPVLVDGGATPGLWSAKQLGERTALIGTPYYAPIELFGGDRPDVQSDVYSVATLLFELATGVQPWVGKSFLDVFQSKLAKEPPRMRDRAPTANVRPDLEEAIRGGLHASRQVRYASAAEFAERLGQCRP